MEQLASAVFAFVLLALVVGAWRVRSRRSRPGTAAAGTLEEMLTMDKRAAIEIILEERAEARDPEHRDGNLPDLEHTSTNGSRRDRGKPASR